MARRARFVAAALAGSGLVTPAVRAQADGATPEESSTEPNCETDPHLQACRPQICLSDIDIEGELVKPPTCPDGSLQPDDGVCPPSVCLGAGCPTEQLQDDGSCLPTVCLSIYVEDPQENLPESHDGFYLRFSLGPGWLHTATQGDLPDGSVKGAVTAVDLRVGHTLLRGMASGLFAGAWHAPSPEAGGGATRLGNGAMTQVLAGPFVDYFPDPRGGLHFGAAPGFMFLQRGAESASDEESTAIGAGAALWVGYDFWMGDDWSVGAALSGEGGFAWGGSDRVSERVVTRGAALMLSALWH